VLAASVVSAAAGWLVLRVVDVRDAPHALLGLGATGTVCLAAYTVVVLALRVPALAELRASLHDLRLRKTRPDGSND
jgi:putative peptidoglycan lipid II flippase